MICMTGLVCSPKYCESLQGQHSGVTRYLSLVLMSDSSSRLQNYQSSIDLQGEIGTLHTGT